MVGTSLVLKKASPNGKLVLYLRCRDYASIEEPIDGVIEVDPSYLKHRKVFAQLVAHFRYGREKDEVMGIKFHRDFLLASTQIFPTSTNNHKLTHIQMALTEKLDSRNVFPFVFYFPPTAPHSVSLQSREKEERGKSCGIHYYVKVFVGEGENDIPHRRSLAKLNIRRLQYVSSDIVKQPSHTWAKQNFVICTGDIELEASIAKQFYETGEMIQVHVTVQNNSNKVVKKIYCTLYQNVNIQMLQKGQYKIKIDEHVTKSGCPIRPGSSVQVTMSVRPSLKNNRTKEGVALDGHHKLELSDLASSTFMHHNNSVKDVFGVIVSYFIRVRLYISPLQDISTQIPFVLMPTNVTISYMYTIEIKRQTHHFTSNSKLRNVVAK